MVRCSRKPGSRTVLTVLAMVLAGPASGDEPDSTAAEIRAVGQAEMTVQDGYRYIRSNGLPNHATGRFPNRNNPNQIREQERTYRIPLNPQNADRPVPLALGKFGVALNGIPFDPGAAEFWNRDPQSGWQYEALGGQINLGLDSNHAHVQPDGTYHYHGLPRDLVLALMKAERMVILGFAADGYPVYAPLGHTDPTDASSPLRKLKSGYRVKSGPRRGGPGGSFDGTFVQDYEFIEGSGDLDAQNGRFGVTPEFPRGTYYYVITTEFPFIPRSLKGVPDPGFRPPGRRERPPGRLGPPRGRPGPRPPAGPPRERPPRS